METDGYIIDHTRSDLSIGGVCRLFSAGPSRSAVVVSGVDTASFYR